MKVIPWRVSNFVNLHFHRFWMLLKFGTTNLNTVKYWDEQFRKGYYKESEDTCNVFNEMVNLITPGASVLDVGVGSGYFLKRLRQSRTSNVFGIDISPIAIGKLKEGGIEGICCELPAKPLINRTFDFITAKALIEHLKYPSLSLKVLADLLKANGKVIVAVPNDTLGPENNAEHFRRYDKSLLHKELSHSFKVRSIDVIDNCLLAVCERKNCDNGL